MLAPAQLLATWEEGLTMSAAAHQRALLLHSLAHPGHNVDEILTSPIGARDIDLFALRGRLFGSRMSVRLTCDQCTAELEFDADAAEFVDTAPIGPGPFTVTDGDWEVRFRLATPGDLLAVRELSAGGASADDARSALTARIVLSARCAGRDVMPDFLPAQVVARIAAAATAADPASDIRINARCPECSAELRALLDITSYLWDELDAWARAILMDVHLLAASYGWTEADVLALSPLRRRYYVELVSND